MTRHARHSWKAGGTALLLLGLAAAGLSGSGGTSARASIAGSEPPELRQLRHPASRTATLVLPPLAVGTAGPATLSVGALYARRGGEDTPGELALLIELRSLEPTGAFEEGIRLRLCSGDRVIERIEARVGRLHTITETRSGVVERVLVPVSVAALSRALSRPDLRLALPNGASVELGPDHLEGLRSLLAELPVTPRSATALAAPLG